METISIIFLGSVFVLFVWLIWLTVSQVRFMKKFKELFRSDKGDIYEILKAYLSDVKKVEDYAQKLEAEFKKLTALSRKSIQKISFLRYNPFGNNDTGGNQSFSIAVLDYENNGFILTSIHSREGTRVYSKQIKSGKSNYNLSVEEEAVLKKVI